MPPFTSNSMILRAALRRRIEQLRAPRIPRRFQSQSSASGPKPSEAPKPSTAETPIPPGGSPVAAPGFWHRLGPITWAGQAYGRAQRKRPWATQIASGLVIYFAADVSAQRIGGKDYVPERTVRNLIIGGTAAVPNFVWFVWLSKNLNFSSHIVSLGVKILVNQMVFTPIFNSYFFGAQALLAGDSLAETWDRVRRTVPVSWRNAWKVWPAVMAFSFTYVPIQYRSIFAGVVAVGWQTYLSYLNRKAEIDEEEKIAAAAAATLPPAVEKAPIQIDAEKRRIPA